MKASPIRDHAEVKSISDTSTKKLIATANIVYTIMLARSFVNTKVAVAKKINSERSPPLHQNQYLRKRKEKKKMINAVIKKGDKASIVSLPASRMNMAHALAEIGIETPAQNLSCISDTGEYEISFLSNTPIEKVITGYAEQGVTLSSINNAILRYRDLPYGERENFERNVAERHPKTIYDFTHRTYPFANNNLTETFYFPLTVELCERDEYGDLEEEGTECNARYAYQHSREIERAFLEYSERDINDMSEYFEGNNSLVAKIKSMKWGFAERNGMLFGKVDVLLKDHLTDSDRAELKDYITGQNSDGLSEGFEQQDIKVDDGVLSVHFWNWDDDYEIYTEDEFDDYVQDIDIGGI